MPARLLDHPLAGVDQDERHVGVGCTGDHVARVLGVPGGVGDDELALGRGEVAVGHVDGDALLPLGAQPVGQQRQVRLDPAPLLAGAADRLELVLEDPLGVVEEAADQRGLAVVHRAGRGQAQELGHLEVPLALAVLHAGLGDPVVGPGGAPLGQSGARHLGDDEVDGLGHGLDAAGAVGVAHRPEAHHGLEDRIPLRRGQVLA